MPRRAKPAEPQQAILSLQQKKEAIIKIDRRIAELKEFDPNTVDNRSDSRITGLSTKLASTLDSIFPSGTVEHNRYSWAITRIDTASVNLMHQTPLSEVRQGLQRGIERSISTLEAIKSSFEEDLEDAGMGATTGNALRAYEGLELHPEIERAAGALFRDAHYANAVEDAVKALNNLVRLRSGLELDGTSLMEQAFSPKNPILKFNAFADQTDIDEQRGFMMLFSGAVSGLRNPRAHRLIKDDPESALEFIAFVSLLAKQLDRTKR